LRGADRRTPYRPRMASAARMACSLESGDHACLFVGSTSERLLLHELLEGLAEAQPVVVDAEGAGRPLGGDDHGHPSRSFRAGSVSRASST
jgi:hypothetical protein